MRWLQRLSRSRRGSTMLLGLIFITFVGVTCSFGLWLLASSAAVHSRLTLITQSAAYAAGSVATAEANLAGGVASIDPTLATQRAQAFLADAVSNDPFDLSANPGDPNHVNMTVTTHNILMSSDIAKSKSPVGCPSPIVDVGGGVMQQVCWTDDLGQTHYATGVQVNATVRLCLIDSMCGQPWLPRWTIRSSGYSKFTVRQVG